MPSFRLVFRSALISLATLTVAASTGSASTGAADDATAPTGMPEMAGRIDQLLKDSRSAQGVRAAAPASDAEFLRRISLDLTGRIPDVSHVRSFLADKSSDKRSLLIERLLAGPSHATHLATLWDAFLLPEQPGVRRFNASPFQAWLRGKFADNQPYDAIVRELMLASGQVNQAGPAYYYTSQQLVPETLAANTSRALLGVQIQCAQCHDHPFDDWSQESFWGYAAFFAQLSRPTNRQAFVGAVMDTGSGEVKLPDTDQVIPPQFLDGTESPDQENVTRRQRLTDWLVSDQNPYFARAAVNRVWAIMFGRGLVDPVDNFGESNPPSHPELLDELANYLIHTGFDLRNLIRTLANTQAYQLSSSTIDGDPADPALFSRMAVKTLTAEQLYDCLAQATARREAAAGNQNVAGRFNQNRTTFVNQFRSAGDATDYQRGIPQALTLMNGQLVATATDLQRSDILVALQAPFFTDEQRVETLFLAALSRLPNERERDQFIGHVTSKAESGEQSQALSDILWALLNSAEFTLNH